MIQTTEIREAILRLSSIEFKECLYDPSGQILGDGPILYLVEIGNLFFIEWENNDTDSIIVNSIICFDLDELEELGFYESWTVMRLPATSKENVQFREIENGELATAYQHSEVFRTTQIG